MRINLDLCLVVLRMSGQCIQWLLLRRILEVVLVLRVYGIDDLQRRGTGNMNTWIHLKLISYMAYARQVLGKRVLDRLVKSWTLTQQGDLFFLLIFLLRWIYHVLDFWALGILHLSRQCWRYKEVHLQLSLCGQSLANISEDLGLWRFRVA